MKVFSPRLGPILLTKDFREEFFPAVAPFGVGGIGVGFLQCRTFGSFCNCVLQRYADDE